LISLDYRCALIWQDVKVFWAAKKKGGSELPAVPRLPESASQLYSKTKMTKKTTERMACVKNGATQKTGRHFTSITPDTWKHEKWEWAKTVVHFRVKKA